MNMVWVAFENRGYDYERDFAGVFATAPLAIAHLDPNQLMNWTIDSVTAFGRDPEWKTDAPRFHVERYEIQEALPKTVGCANNAA